MSTIIYELIYSLPFQSLFSSTVVKQYIITEQF